MVNIESQENKHFSYTFQNIKLKRCGKIYCLTGLEIENRISEDYIMYIILSGKGFVKLNDEKVEFEKNSAILVYPGQQVSFERDDYGLYLWMDFNGGRVESILKQIGFIQNSVIQLSNTTEIEEEMTKLLKYKSCSLSNELKKQSVFYNLLSLLMDYSKNATDDSIKARTESLYVSQALEIIQKNCNKTLKASDIAKQIGINRSYLTNLFKKEVGMSPQSYIIEDRLEKAAILIKETNRSLVDVALEVGYNDSLAFSKSFKQKYGVSPSKYRKEY